MAEHSFVSKIDPDVVSSSSMMSRRHVNASGFAYGRGSAALSPTGAFSDLSRVPVRALQTTQGFVEPVITGLRQPDAGTGPDAGTPTTPTFPTYAQIIANGTVSTTMDTAWADTKAATTATSRREQGFWIKYNTAGSSYTCAPTFTGPSVGPDETGSAIPGAKPADSGTVYTVGLFHTHTPMVHRTGTRNVGPSTADNSFHTSNNVVGVIYDYKESPAGSGSIPGGHPLSSAARLYSSGPARRT